MSTAVVLLAAFIAGLLPQDPPRYTESVNVARVLIDARAIDRSGRPLLGLSAENFHVKIDGKAVRVESAQWVAGALTETDVASVPSGSQALRAINGRLVVFLFQKSLDKSRIVGFMKMLLELRGFLDGFTPHDRLAVLSFDSRLRLWVDFTSDLDRVRRVLADNLLFGGPAPMNQSEYPSLAETLDVRSMDRASTIEAALGQIADALAPLPGAKTVVLIGHGFGGGGLPLENRYDDVRAALQEARASVFCLDVTDAASHSLEAGLQMVADDTGGFFERTHIFSRRALDRLGATLAAHYVLIVEKPDAKPGTHRIDVKLKDRQGSVFAKAAYVD